MELLNITKVKEGKGAYEDYFVSSLACPDCKQVLTVQLPGHLLYQYNIGADITEVFPTMSADDRERFITGYCGPCWTAIFGEDDEDDEGDE